MYFLEHANLIPLTNNEINPSSNQITTSNNIHIGHTPFESNSWSKCNVGNISNVISYFLNKTNNSIVGSSIHKSMIIFVLLCNFLSLFIELDLL